MSPVVRATPAASSADSHSSAKAAPSSAKTQGKQSQRIPGAGKIVDKDLPTFSRQLAAMLSAGMPIVASLEALEEQAENPNFKAVIGRIKKSIENGSAFSEALRPYPSIFNDLYVNMVRGGETGGQLAETVGRLAGFLEASAALKRKVKSAMMYPTIVLCLALTIAVAMIIFVVPVFGEMFADFGAKLPGPTQALLDMSHFLKRRGIFVFGALAAVVIAFKKWKQTPQGAFAFDSFLLKAPVFGELNRKVAAARFARTFGQLTRSGVLILNALDIAAGATGNKVATAVILKAKETVEKGEPLSSALVNQPVFPMLLVRMLQAGEKTGKVDEMMDNIADFYDSEVETMLEGLTSLLEPLLMVFLGVIIGGIVLCMFLPIFKMGEVVSGGGAG